MSTPAQKPNSADTAPGVGRYLIVSFQVAVIGSTLIGLAECLSASLLSSAHFEGRVWPVGIIAAAAGKAIVTHSIFWVPPVVLITLLASCVPVVRRQTGPLVPAVVTFLSVAAITVVPADVRLGTKWRLATAEFVAYACLVLCLLAVFMLHRMVLRRADQRRVMRVLTSLFVPSLVVLAGSGIAFYRSPLFNPAAYRVPPAKVSRGNPKGPHVLWIVMDTVRSDRMSCYGHHRETTPFLESWAKRSIVFDNVIANGRWTVPSHSSMFTGASVRRHGMDSEESYLPDRFETVADVLSANGYVTAAYSNNPFVSRTTNIVQGFDEVHAMYYVRHLAKFSIDMLLESWGVVPPFPWLDPDFGGAMTNEMVAQWLDTHTEGNAPLFLFVNYMEAHLPYMVPARYQRMVMSDSQVDRSYELRRWAYGPVVQTLDKQFNLQRPGLVRPSDIEIYRRQYEAGIRYVDSRIEELIGMFDERGLLDDTLVIIVSDHGEHLDTHGMWGHQFLTYNDTTHVAMMLHEPGRDRPMRIGTPVQPSDLYPTVLDFVLGGANRDSPLESRDLFDVARSGGEPRIVITECAGPNPRLRKRTRESKIPEIMHRSTPQIAAQDGRFKYIASGDGLRELFDLDSDPGELHNVLAQYPDEVTRLSAYIHKWQADIPPPPPEEIESVADTDPEFVEALRSLGYLGD